MGTSWPQIVEVPVEKVIIKEIPIEVVKEVIVERIVEVKHAGALPLIFI